PQGQVQGQLGRADSADGQGPGRPQDFLRQDPAALRRQDGGDARRGPAEARAVPQGPAGPAGRTGRPGGADARQGQGRQGRCQGEDGQGAGEAEGAARGGGQALRGPQGGRQGHLGRPDPTDGQGARAAQEGRRRGQGPLQISGRPENRESF